MAIDTTLVCPLTREDPELAGDRGRGRLVVFAGEVGGRFSDENCTVSPSSGVSESPGSPPVVARSSSRCVATTVECSAGMCRRSCFCTLAFGQGLFHGPTSSMHEVLGDSCHFLSAAAPFSACLDKDFDSFCFPILKKKKEKKKKRSHAWTSFDCEKSQKTLFLVEI